MWLLTVYLRHRPVESPYSPTHLPEFRLSTHFLQFQYLTMLKGLLCCLVLFKGKLFTFVSPCCHGKINKSRTEWPLKFITSKMGRTVAMLLKIFSTNFRLQQMRQRLLQLLRLFDFFFSAVFILDIPLKYK